MGNVFRIVYKTNREIADIYVDFECDSPSERENELWSRVKFATLEMHSILDYMQNYRGAQENIGMAIRSPKNEKLQEDAWNAVLPLAENLKKFYLFSIELQSIVKELLAVICSDELSKREHLTHEQALYKQFADILHFTLMFDQIKISTPSIQNDFSYYRRMFSLRDSSFNETTGSYTAPEVMTQEMSTNISFFYASPNPLLLGLANTTQKFVDENPGLPLEKTADCLSTMAYICRTMIETPEFRDQFSSEDTNLYCLRVMVASIVLYDHIEPRGAFAKTSPINIKSTIKTLRNQRGGDILVNTLRYTTKHLNDELTPKTVRALFT